MSANKYFKLYDNFILREWAGLPRILFNRDNFYGNPLSDIEFQALQMAADGVPADSWLMTQPHRDFIATLAERKYGEYSERPCALSEDQTLHSTKASFVQNLHWSVTGRCNLRCRHCYVDAPDALYGEASSERLDEAIKQISDANIMIVSLTGGEPLVLKDFFGFYKKLKDRKIAVSTLYTNGLLLDEAWLDRFASLESRKIRFSLSFDGVGCHDWLRGRNGMEKRTLDAVRLLKARGYQVEIETALYKDNLGALLQAYELFKTLGVDIWKLSLIQSSKAWAQYEASHGLTSELDAFEAYIALLKRFGSDKRPFLLQLGGVYLFDGEKSCCPMRRGDGTDSCLDSPLCSCAAIVPYLLPNGVLLPCMPMANSDFEKEMPNIFETPMEDVLSKGSSYFKLVSMPIREMFDGKPSKCQSCAHRLVCLGGCRAYALRAGNLYGPDPNCCLFWNGGHYERFKEFFF